MFRREFQKLVKDNRIWWGADGNNVPAIKRFLSDVKKGVVPETIWTYKEVGHTQDAKKKILDIFGGEMVFMTPKPVELLKRIINIATDESDLVLDSFAGSGTTAEAVLELNQQDGSNREFVLVQQPYDSREGETNKLNISRKVTAERVRRVIEGYIRSNGNGRKEKVEGLGGSFTYARLSEKPLFGEYRDLGKKLPKWEDLARYIFYTETSRECDTKKMDEATGFIGSTDAAGGTSYYLLYTPNNGEDQRVSLLTLPALLKKDKNHTLVIYAERIWLHGDELAKFEKEHGRKIRPMLVPFGVK